MQIRTTALVACAAAALAGTSYAATQRIHVRPGGSSVVPLNVFRAAPLGARITGTLGNDAMVGNKGDDRLAGGPGDDVISGGFGNDILFGGIGHDVLRGGPGRDVIYARDGEWDVVDGGPGFDLAYVDQFDIVTHVERVKRATDAKVTLHR